MRLGKGISNTIAAGLLLGTIVGISPLLARADTGQCVAFAAQVPGFELAANPEPAPTTVFFEDGTLERRLADYAGKPIVLNFWATWCAPCVREMPDLDSLRAALLPDGIEVLAVSEDRSGLAKVDPFYAEAGIVNLPKLVDDRGKLSRALGVRAMPTTVLFDDQGLRIGHVVGTAHWVEPETLGALRSCLGGETAR